MQRRTGCLAAMVLLVAMLVSACGTSSGLNQVKKAGKLMVGIDTTYPPMETIADDGKTPEGFDVDLAKAIAAKLGVQAEFVITDWDGIIPALTGKRFDVIISSMNITEERMKKGLDFVEYVQMSQLFVTRTGAPPIQSEKELDGKVILVQVGTTSHEWADEVKANSVPGIKEVRSFPDATDIFLELKNGRGDVIVVDEPVGLYYAMMDPATFAIAGHAMDPEPVGIALRKSDTDLKKAIEQAVKDLNADGTFKRISETWFGEHQLGK